MKSIWLDESSDHNDRVALIVGQFNLTQWLDGSLVDTFIVRNMEKWIKDLKMRQSVVLSYLESNNILSNEGFEEYLRNSLQSNASDKNAKNIMKEFIGTTLNDFNEFYEVMAERDATGRAGTLVDLDEKAKCLMHLLFRKHPSPARIRRIWETTFNFWQKTVEAILVKGSYGRNTPREDLRRKRLIFEIEPVLDSLSRGTAYDLNIGDISLSPVWDGERFISTDNLQIYPESWGKTEDEIVRFLERKRGTLKGEDWKREVALKNVNLAPGEFQNYSPFTEIYASSDKFIVLVPAFDTSWILSEIIKKYEIEFSKVRDRLSLYLGIVFFHRKTPLYSAMDAGNRIIESAIRLNAEVQAEVISNDDALPEKIQSYSQSKLGSKVRELKLKLPLPYEPSSSRKVELLVSYSTGDPDIEDIWYPYLRLSNSPSSPRNLQFQLADGTACVHVKHLNSEDQIKVCPSLFTFIFLESSVQRFRAGEEWMLLEDYEILRNLWNKIKEMCKSGKLTLTRLQGIKTLLETKRDEWEEGSEEWKKLVKTALKNDFKLSPGNDIYELFYNTILDGRFLKCLEFHLKILKEKLEVQQ